MQKSYQMCAKVFSLYSDPNSTSNFACNEIHIEFLMNLFPYISIFANFKAKIGRNGSKNQKSIL
jgi:hypothetical protein